MSLIERTLGKVRKSGVGRDMPVTARRAPLQPPVSRVVADPQLRVTREMRQQLGLELPDEHVHQRASEYRQIKRQVVAEIRSNPDDRVVIVTSALAGEGKSFTSANLARSLAMEPDYTVLLVDGDAVKPALSRALQITHRPGLMNALGDASCDVNSLILTTDIEGLSVLPAGSSSENATEYFGSERMRLILAALQSVPNRIVLIDSLPLLLTTEARVLMPLASQVLLVVRAESTPQAAVQQALNLIGETGNVKLVLNASVRTRLSRYFGYDYGFDYDYSTQGK
ncbi:MAG: AAA family ATPase [Pseudomonadota bacterium]